MKNNILTLVIIFVYLIFICENSCQSVYDAQKLHNDVMSGYVKTVRPATNMSSPTDVTAHLILYKILDVNLPLGVFQVVMGVMMSWNDVRISWNTSEYNGVNKLLMTKDAVWYPQLVFAIVTEPIKAFGEKTNQIEYRSDGTAVSLDVDLATVSCNFDQRKYPYDEHVCDVFGVVQGPNAEDIRFILPAVTLDLNYFQENPEWILKENSCFPISFPTFVGIACTVKIKRREKHFMVINFIPLVLLSLLNTLIFKLPIESGERIGFGITCLLALAVYLSEITGALPSGSQNMSYVSFYLTGLTIISSLLCAAAIFSSRIYYRSESKQISAAYMRLVKLTNWRPERKLRNKIKAKTVVKELANEDLANKDDSGHDLLVNKMTWMDVSDAIDKVMFLLGILVVAVSLIAICVVLVST